MVTVILEAAAQVASVQRVIITSSCVTLVPFEWNSAPDSERLYTGILTLSRTPDAPWAYKTSGRHQLESNEALR